MRRAIKIGCGLAAGLVLGLAGLSAFFFIAGRDIDPPDVSWTRRNGCGTAEVNGYSSWSAYRCLGTGAFATEASRVAIASARYNRKLGGYPPTLDALVPEFLAEVPRDPFDAAKPLGYNAEQGTLHTVGADGNFNGKARDPRLRYGGITSPDWRYIRRIDGRPMEIPLKVEARENRE